MKLQMENGFLWCNMTLRRLLLVPPNGVRHRTHRNTRKGADSTYRRQICIHHRLTIVNKLVSVNDSNRKAASILEFSIHFQCLMQL